jgi:two-component system, NtrC family, response regulator GlrR
MKRRGKCAEFLVEWKFNMPSQRAFRILIVEDDPDMAALLARYLERDGFRVSQAASIKQARDAVARQSFDAILLDFYVGDETALSFIPEVSNAFPWIKVIVLTGQGSIDLAVDCMQRGAASFLTKSTNPERISEVLREKLDQGIPHAKVGTDTEWASKLGLIGKSEAFRDVLRQIEAISEVDGNVLLLGESGTGKELLARAIHELSPRSRNAFEAINCGAIPESLLESELFGHRKGAFTDARQDHAGIFESCNNGTLFLDEIGEIPRSLQVKLLRVLQDREIRPLGASKSMRINTRVVTATNRDLAQAVADGHFREDLLFRLTVFPVHIPPLRERKDDIPLLVSHFLEAFANRYRKTIRSIPSQLVEEMVSYQWPGNVRQLLHALERAVVMSRDGNLDRNVLFSDPITLRARKEEKGAANKREDSQPVSYTDAKEQFEHSYLVRLLSVTRGNLSEAARLSGRVRSDLYRLIDKYGIRQEDFRGSEAHH